jgi:hypothetical protein
MNKTAIENKLINRRAITVPLAIVFRVNLMIYVGN